MYVQGPVGEGRGSFPAVGHGSAMPTPAPGHSTHGLEGEKEEKRVLVQAARASAFAGGGGRTETLRSASAESPGLRVRARTPRHRLRCVRERRRGSGVVQGPARDGRRESGCDAGGARCRARAGVTRSMRTWNGC